MKNWKGAISGSLLIAGTTIGAGMLGIPLITGQAGLWPALLMTVVVWLYMLCTGLLFLEVMLWMPKGSNILSMAKRFMGVKGQWRRKSPKYSEKKRSKNTKRGLATERIQLGMA